MRIAIVGTGISGLVCASRLHAQHDVTLYEANDYIGGHTNTRTVEWQGETHEIDTGFIVFNDRTYPNFCRLLRDLEVDSLPTTMSFSVRCDRSGLEYNGTSLNGVFAQRRNVLRPRFHRMLRDILRFNKEAPELLADPTASPTVGEYLRENRYSRQFTDHYLLPMGAAIWSCPPGTFAAFPMRFIAEFYQNHGLLSLRNRPTWRVIQGGSRTYVKKLVRGFRDRIRLSTPVRSVTRQADSVWLRTDESAEQFDEVVFACHSDQAVKILGHDVTTTERSVLSAFPYEPNTAVLHTDERLLPRKRRAWACWNYRIRPDAPDQASVTYHMNALQHLQSRGNFCVTLNGDDLIDPKSVIARFRYSHPIFTSERAAAQSRHSELIRVNRTSFCGAYWGNGFHEDGVTSAIAVADRFALGAGARPREAVSNA